MSELKTLFFIELGQNIILIGPPGTGKSHIKIGFRNGSLFSGLPCLFHNRSILY
ncbi:ATP-binding protein [Halolactibacillus alkaliphilus]|uniref:ATP-binding protein n=1 Tax=Halolactibacillus alkaliphilus TaxID=442899 RepID=UPI0027E4D29D|nr:ATP-binding protein [Halolactibacillus alkaliphilus]